MRMEESVQERLNILEDLIKGNVSIRPRQTRQGRVGCVHMTSQHSKENTLNLRRWAAKNSVVVVVV